MKKFINDPKNIVREMLEGYLLANGADFEKIPGYTAFKKTRMPSRVAVMSCGGAGCEPMHLGYVGEGMGDATCIGDVFAAPSAYAIYETAKRTQQGKGVLLICGNFNGDFLNMDMAAELLRLDGIETRLVLVKDDVSSAALEQKEKRGGVAGIIYVVKIASAASEAGKSLDEVAELAQMAADNVYTVSAILYSGYNPQTGKAMFEMPEDMYEIGMGFNGEPGVQRKTMAEADKIMQDTLPFLFDEMQLCKNEKVCVMVNSMGSTSYAELLILYRKLHELAVKAGACIYDVKLNRYLSSQEMGGCSFTFFRMRDALKPYFDWAARTPVFFHPTRKGDIL